MGDLGVLSQCAGNQLPLQGHFSNGRNAAFDPMQPSSPQKKMPHIPPIKSYQPKVGPVKDPRFWTLAPLKEDSRASEAQRQAGGNAAPGAEVAKAQQGQERCRRQQGGLLKSNLLVPCILIWLDGILCYTPM